MVIIKPISDLRNKTDEISKIAHREHEPIFITKNGEGNLVIMSLAHYEQLRLKLQLYSKLAEAQAQIAAGEKGQSLKQAMKDLRKRVRETK